MFETQSSNPNLGLNEIVHETEKVTQTIFGDLASTVSSAQPDPQVLPDNDPSVQSDFLLHSETTDGVEDDIFDDLPDLEAADTEILWWFT